MPKASIRSRDTSGLVLACNAGSSSLKIELLDPGTGWQSVLEIRVRDIGRAAPTLSVAGRDERVEAHTHRDAAELALDRLERGDSNVDLSASNLMGVGHRIVHGGDDFTAPTLLDAAALARLRALTELAPLHNGPAIAVVESVTARWPTVPAVAVFDTAFFRSLPERARVYAVPSDWVARYGIKRYGFHGIAHEYLAQRLAAVGGGMPRRMLTLQLGQGCSIAAQLDGRPVETSMGFTPVEGLVMGTRSGDVDAGAVLHVARGGRTADELDDDLNRRSGLLGLSGCSDDVRELVGLERDGHAGAKLALDVFCHRVRKYLGGYAAVMGGLDAIGFGGGIGENSALIRARICAALEWLGVEIDADANERCIGCDGRISTRSSKVDVRVVTVRETLAIGRAVLAALGRAAET